MITKVIHLSWDHYLCRGVAALFWGARDVHRPLALLDTHLGNLLVKWIWNKGQNYCVKLVCYNKERQRQMEGSNGWIEWGVWHYYSTVRRHCTTLPLWRHCTILALCDSGCKQLTNQRSWRETNCHFAPSLYHFSSIQSFSSSYHFAPSLYLFFFFNSSFFSHMFCCP